jgi:photosystem II stability/assembly factor-like uncharacterized protein
MKRILVFSFIVFAASPCFGQWLDIGLGKPTEEEGYNLVTFGIHDSALFFAPNPGAQLVRFGSLGWVHADNGIDFSQGSVTSFASLGRYFFAAQTQSDGTGTAGPVYRSSDSGRSWKQLQAAGPIASNGEYLFASSFTSIYRSSDSGNQWQSVSGPLSSTYAANGACIFANTWSAIWRSRDNGTTWAKIPAPFPGTMTMMDTLLFVVGNGKIAKSGDSGTSWSMVRMDSGSVNVLVTDGKHLFAGTTHGVFVSSDTGVTWRGYNEGLSKAAAYPSATALLVFDTLLVADFDVGNGLGHVTARSIREMTDTTKAAVQPVASIKDTLLVYPNPLTGLVTIRGSYEIEQVSVMNVLGVRELTQPCRGEEEVTLNLLSLPSGTYFLLIETLKGTVLRKIVKE